MAEDFFALGAWTLLTFTGTSSYAEWHKVLSDTYKDIKQEYGTKEAKSDLSRMVAFWSFRVRDGYRGVRALEKFPSVKQWPNYRSEWTNGKLLREWEDYKREMRRIGKRRTRLQEIPSLPAREVHTNYTTADIYFLICEQATKRHGEEAAMELAPILATLISIYGPVPFQLLKDRRLLYNWDKLRNLRTSYYLEHTLDKEFGDKMIEYKQNWSETLYTK